jgi:hypothetical protein
MLVRGVHGLETVKSRSSDVGAVAGAAPPRDPQVELKDRHRAAKMRAKAAAMKLKASRLEQRAQKLKYNAKQLEEFAGRLERGAAIAEEPHVMESTFGTDPRKPL